MYIFHSNYLNHIYNAVCWTGVGVMWKNIISVLFFSVLALQKRQDLGVLRGRLNLEYQASMDANSRYRALHIIKPGPDLSGDYTCSVSTFQSEDVRTKKMLVFGEWALFSISLCSYNFSYTMDMLSVAKKTDRFFIFFSQRLYLYVLMMLTTDVKIFEILVTQTSMGKLEISFLDLSENYCHSITHK